MIQCFERLIFWELFNTTLLIVSLLLISLVPYMPVPVPSSSTISLTGTMFSGICIVMLPFSCHQWEKVVLDVDNKLPLAAQQ
jgi:hypothetical protein